jgi:RNA polymerase sigma factor (TIGR02999 family)
MGSAGPPEAFARLLDDWNAGESSALRDLIPVAYNEIKRLAIIHSSVEAHSQTLQPTALVNEVYLRLAGLRPVNLRDRVHFLSLISRMMRHILVDHARQKRAQKRRSLRVTLSEQVGLEPFRRGSDIILVGEALQRLESEQPDMVRVVEMRFFGGMTAEEIAAAMGRTVPSVNHLLRLAKMWLRRELGGETSQ